MCIKIIGTEEQEFNPSQPLEHQAQGATEIIVSYDPLDPKIDSFVNQMERIVKYGISCSADIKVNTNNYLSGIKLERKLEKLKKALDTNELIRRVSAFHYDVDTKLNEISKMCLGESDE